MKKSIEIEPRKSRNLPRKRVRIVLVTNQLRETGSLNGIGSVCSGLLSEFESAGFDITVLVPVRFLSTDLKYLRKKFGSRLQSLTVITFSSDVFSSSARAEVLRRSDAILEFLKCSRPDFAIFNDAEGLAYSALKYKRTKKAQVDFHSKILVLFHGPNLWHVKWTPRILRQLELRSIMRFEAYCLRHADLVVFPSNWAKKLATRLGLVRHRRVRVQLFPAPLDEKKVRRLTRSSIQNSDQSAKEILTPSLRPIAYWGGRLCQRKGLFVFLSAILRLKKAGLCHGEVFLVGAVDRVLSATRTIDFVSTWCRQNEIALSHRVFASPEEAICFFRSNQVRVAIPSLEETMGCVLQEAMRGKLDFICSDIEPFTDLLGKESPRLFRAGSAISLSRAMMSDLPPFTESEVKSCQYFEGGWAALIANELSSAPASVLPRKTLRKFCHDLRIGGSVVLERNATFSLCSVSSGTSNGQRWQIEVEVPPQAADIFAIKGIHVQLYSSKAAILGFAGRHIDLGAGISRFDLRVGGLVNSVGRGKVSSIRLELTLDRRDLGRRNLESRRRPWALEVLALMWLT